MLFWYGLLTKGITLELDCRSKEKKMLYIAYKLLPNIIT